MIGLLQRVTHAQVDVDGETVGAIGAGLMVLVGVTPEDDERNAKRLAERLLGYRVFADETGRMNRSVNDIAGGVLAVPQFTLAADTAKGTRPSFSCAAEPARANELFDALVRALKAGATGPVGTGRFGADMQVALTNDGPVTFWLTG